MFSHLPRMVSQQGRTVKMLQKKKKKSALPHQLSEVPDWLLVLEALSTPDPRGPSPETGRAHLTPPPNAEKRNWDSQETNDSCGPRQVGC